MRLLILAAVGLGLAACSGEDKTAAAPAESAAAALPPGRPAVYAVQAEGPEPFVRALYAIYVAGGPKEPPPAAGQDPLYSRMLNATLGADVRVAKGEGPTVNYDILCGCQDQGAFTLDTLGVVQSGPNAATAEVAFTNAGKTTRQTLNLVREGINWKVDDVIGEDGQSLREATVKVIEAKGG